MPDATVAGLIERRGLRVWTEMFSDGILALERAGALDPDVPLSTSFVFGTAELYEWLDGNERVVLRRTEVTNSPARIAEQRQMTSVNTALQIDLFGQANASRIDADLLRVRRPDGLHRGGAALPRRAGVHGAAVVAPARRTARRSCPWSTSR